MRRSFLRLARLVPPALVAAALVSACSPRHDFAVEWTVDGVGPADACAVYGADAKVVARALSSDSEAGETVDESTTVDCTDGEAIVPVGNFSTVLFDLTVGDTTVGVGGPVSTSPGLGADYVGNPEAPVSVDISPTKGRLTARLTVLGQSCTDAGVDSFNVTLRRQRELLFLEVVEEDVTVACGAEGAVYNFDYVEIGDDYIVSATASAGGTDYATDGEGEGIVAAGSRVDFVVDLDAVTPAAP